MDGGNPMRYRNYSMLVIVIITLSVFLTLDVVSADSSKKDDFVLTAKEPVAGVCQAFINNPHFPIEKNTFSNKTTV